MTIPLLVAALLVGAQPDAAVWPAFRGRGDNLAQAGNLPLEWSDGSNVAWTARIDGYGQSSPVVWAGRVYVTSAEGSRKETLVVTALALADGRQLWKQTIDSSAPAAVSDYISRAAPTPTVDDQAVYAFFESGDLVALDHAGRQRWRRRLAQEYGDIRGNHGLGSSPALHDGTLFVLIDHEGPSYLLAIDTQTGRNRWKADRPLRVSWTSPLVVGRGDDALVVVSSSGQVDAYRASDGQVVWHLSGLDGNTVASPTAAGDLVVIGGSEPSANLAIRLPARGRLAADQVAWRSTEALCSFASPLAVGERLYFVDRGGVAVCLDRATGSQLWKARLSGSCWATPLAAGQRVYFFGKDGVTTVVAADTDEFRRLAENTLSIDGRVYGVAAVDGAILLRTGSQLICLGRRAAD